MASRVFDTLFRLALKREKGVWQDAVRLGSVMPFESAIDLLRAAGDLHAAGVVYLDALERIRRDSVAVAAMKRKLEGRPLSAESAAVLALLKDKFPW